MSHSRLGHCLLLHVERSEIHWQGKVFPGCTINVTCHCLGLRSADIRFMAQHAFSM